MKIKATLGDINLYVEHGKLTVEDSVSKDYREVTVTPEQVYAIFSLALHPGGSPNNSDELYELIPKEIIALPQHLRPIP